MISSNSARAARALARRQEIRRWRPASKRRDITSISPDRMSMPLRLTASRERGRSIRTTSSSMRRRLRPFTMPCRTTRTCCCRPRPTARGAGTVNTSGVGDIFINSVIDWTTDAALTIDAYHSIDIAAVIHASGAGTLNLDDNDAGTNGSLDFTPTGQVWFVSLNGTATQGSLNINGPYTLVANLATLASDIAIDPAGDFALAETTTLQLMAPTPRRRFPRRLPDPSRGLATGSPISPSPMPRTAKSACFRRSESTAL